MLPDGVKDLIRAGALGHLVTTNADGSAQVTCVWVGIDGDDLFWTTGSAQQSDGRAGAVYRLVITTGSVTLLADGEPVVRARGSAKRPSTARSRWSRSATTPSSGTS